MSLSQSGKEGKTNQKRISEFNSERRERERDKRGRGGGTINIGKEKRNKAVDVEWSREEEGRPVIHFKSSYVEPMTADL